MSNAVSSPPTQTNKRPHKTAPTNSINHLLNFSLPPRQSNPAALPRRSRKTAQHGVWNKERFVNAQYRFLMNPTGDYTVHFADPDIFFQWQDILQVIIPRSSAIASSGDRDEGHTSCPICLSTPTAPRMTKCGHVFCYPCILHYLNTSDTGKWVRCPLCFDTFNERQLKAVKWFDEFSLPPDEEPQDVTPDTASASSSTEAARLETTPRAGTMMRFRLMQRPSITTLALPRSTTWPSDVLPLHQAPFHFLPNVLTYAKFMLATPDQLIADLAHDLDALEGEKRILGNDTLGVSFIEAAEGKVRHQIEKARALESPHLSDTIERTKREQRELETRAATRRAQQQQHRSAPNPADEIPAEFLAFKGTPSVAADILPPSPAPRQRRNLNPPPPSTSTYYFYQAANGLPIFLHPLDIKILHQHFAQAASPAASGYAALPDSLRLTIAHATPSTVTPDLRKRCKYLSHVPEGADVVFVEVEEHSLASVVGREGLRAFEGALKMRGVRRREREKREERDSRGRKERDRAQVAQLQQQEAWALAPPPSFTPPRSLSPAGTEEGEAAAAAAAQVPASGAWGARSFASTLSAASSEVPPGGRRSRTLAQEMQDEYDFDAAWHEMEQRGASVGNSGRRKKNNKMVVLGGGGGRRMR
ncbi:hypothetical protein BD626DRAFT_486821 [Schizophyllum amplum]|uniref:RING-type domain-containing protein n=1 Tax=Schizophyllum amplum TaxID=97359 RepID=A0A550CMV7_9AGAR|nr:hypothetical protein BD626DRAFT_486821 [Auriculariopsis ampla]